MFNHLSDQEKRHGFRKSGVAHFGGHGSFVIKTWSDVQGPQRRFTTSKPNCVGTAGEKAGALQNNGALKSVGGKKGVRCRLIMEGGLENGTQSSHAVDDVGARISVCRTGHPSGGGVGHSKTTGILFWRVWILGEPYR